MAHIKRARSIRKSWSLLWFALLLFAREPAQGQSLADSEDVIRAALVQHLTWFVEWPAWKMDASHAQFNVCLIGSDPIGPALIEAFRGKPVLQKAVVVTHLQPADKLQDCHLLYVGANARREIQHSLADLKQAAVLTVSERSDFISAGQVIGLPREANRVRIEINLKQATVSKLVISSRLLQLATITERP